MEIRFNFNIILKIRKANKWSVAARAEGERGGAKLSGRLFFGLNVMSQ